MLLFFNFFINIQKEVKALVWPFVFDYKIAERFGNSTSSVILTFTDCFLK